MLCEREAWGDGWAEGSPEFSIPTPHCVLTQSAGIIPPLCLWSPENRGESESGRQGLTHSPPCVCPRPSHPWMSLWFSQQLPLWFSWKSLTIFFPNSFWPSASSVSFSVGLLHRPLQDLSPAGPLHTHPFLCLFLPGQWLWTSTVDNATSCSPLMFPFLFALLLLPSDYFLFTSFPAPLPISIPSLSLPPLLFFPFSSFPPHPQSSH